MNRWRTILSLCDHSGEWSAPYARAGYDVVRVDLKDGGDVRFFEKLDRAVHGILAAPPCTAFTNSGAQYWAEKDADGRTAEGLAVVDACARIVLVHRPVWWVLENPVGRLSRWLGDPVMWFDPCDFGDAYTKRTGLWGRFTPPRLALVWWRFIGRTCSRFFAGFLVDEAGRKIGTNQGTAECYAKRICGCLFCC